MYRVVLPKTPSSLTIQSSLFSHYKYHVTYKGLVGIAPSGRITVISELCDRSISDVEIVQGCGILEKDLKDESDSLMADKGFTVENLLKPCLTKYTSISTWKGTT